LIGFQSFGQADKILTRNGTTIDTAITLETKASAVNRAALKMNIAPVIQTITSGTAATVTDSTTWFIINPASTLASFTLTLPPTPTNGKLVEINFGGTIDISGSNVLTSLTVQPNTSQGIVGTNVFSTLIVEDKISFRYDSSISKWRRN